MDANLKRQWIAALRSGKYTQGTGYLKKDDKFCCLGVLLDLQGCEWIPNFNPSVMDAKLGGHVVKSNGFAGEMWAITLPVQAIQTLMLLNDGCESRGGLPFTEIADWIESNVNAS